LTRGTGRQEGEDGDLVETRWTNKLEFAKDLMEGESELKKEHGNNVLSATEGNTDQARYVIGDMKERSRDLGMTGCRQEKRRERIRCFSLVAGTERTERPRP
jgi:hypothetical protein